MEWYYANNGQRHGPISLDEFARRVSTAEVRGDTLVWRAGMASWQPWSEVAPSVKLPAVADTPPPLAAPATAMTTYSASSEATYGGFWIRLLAKIIDAIALGIVGNILGMLLFGGAMMELQSLDPEDPETLGLLFAAMSKFAALGLVLGLAYHWFFLAKFAATPGKLALGLRIVRSDGSRLSHGRIVGRFFAEYLSTFILYIGYLIAAFDDQKRTLHDYICDTRVVKKR